LTVPAVASHIPVIPVAEAVGLVDRPGGRKSHTGNIPVIGGVAMFLGIFAGMSLFQESGYAVGSLMSASVLLVAIGVIDDRFHLPSAVRFAAQITVALIMVYGAGLSLADVGNPFGIGGGDLSRAVRADIYSLRDADNH
jgi:UDP-GlcNAc:undecaprenyl-phosphate GlcNAc-1-phosphate transferase